MTGASCGLSRLLSPRSEQFLRYGSETGWFYRVGLPVQDLLLIKFTEEQNHEDTITISHLDGGYQHEIAC